MKKALTLLFIFSGFITLFSQTADEVIAHHLEATGGVKNWKNLSSIIIKGETAFDLESVYPMVIYHRRPYQKKVAFIVNGEEVLNEGYDGKNGWTYNDLAKKNVKIPDYQPDSFEDDLLDYDKKGFTAKLLDKEFIEEKECYVVELTKFKNKTIYYIDSSNYTLWAEKNKDETLYYSDYKDFGGLQFATKMIGKPNDGGEYLIRFYQIQINPNIDDKVFKF